MMEFRWQELGDGWVLSPSMITVKEMDGFWIIFVGDRQMTGKYTSAQGARLDAWQFAYSKRRAIFGAYSIRLAEGEN
jgi:hypothetical protein